MYTKNEHEPDSSDQLEKETNVLHMKGSLKAVGKLSSGSESGSGAK